MLPEGWKEIFLGNILDFKNGLNADKAAYGHGCKFVNVMDVINNTIIKHENIIGKVNTTAKNIDLFKLKYGDILFNRTSETKEEIALSSVYMDYSLAVYGGFVIRGRPKNSNINTDFSLYFFQSPSFRNQAIKSAQGVVRANIGQDSLSRILLPLPPLPEQKKIAAILSTWDRAIEGTEQLLANSQQQKKALMQQLLTGKKRLPGFTGEWKNVLLKDIALIKKGQALSSKDLIRGDYPVIAGGKTSPYKHKNFTHENVITVSASGAYAGYVSFHSYKIWASDCSVINSRSGNSISFIYFWLSYLQNKIFSLQSGGAQPHIYPRDLELLHIHCPPLPEQKAIAAVLTTADEEITAIEADLSRLRQEKKALMQQLLTGKIRVVV